MDKKYHASSHCKYLIKLHMIFVCKYSKHLLVNAVDDAMKRLLKEAAEEIGVGMDVIETDRDHVHMLLDVPPTLSATQIASKLKQLSTWRIWKEFEAFLSSRYWKERTFWSDGYFVCSTGDASTETIRQYIEEQG